MLYRPLLTMLAASFVLATLACATLLVHSWGERERVERVAVHVAASEEPGARASLDGLVDELRVHTRREWWIAIALSVMVPGAFLALALQLRRRVLRPLADLNYLIGLLAQRDYGAAVTDGVHPTLRPLFDSYNELVERLMQSESEQESRERTLSREVDSATRVIVQQQMALARAQRLAATGELAARVAHDLRNPLAGIQAAVDNLHRDVEDPDHAERLGLVCDEVRRLTRQLNDLVEGARQTPEPARVVPIAETVRSLLTLAGYQLSDRIRLEHDVPQDLCMRMPEDALRQALLNLILNAARAIGENGGHIRVHADCDEDWATLAVEDDGPGFSADALDMATRPFASFSSGGSGLGLATARRFATDLGGDLELCNRDGGGARVALKLPRKLCDV